MVKQVKHITITILLLLLTILSFGVINPNEINLNGKWKFNVGDNPYWANPNFDDSQWDEIYAPGDWENQGYRKYDGFAWYRKKITPGEQHSDKVIYLELGYIDDVDEVFINGVKVGQTGKFPPHFSTGYKTNRRYLVPNQLIHFGKENTIAIRVFDSRLNGGMVNGQLKMLFKGVSLPLDINLAGEWFFNKGKEVNLEDKSPIIVPGIWENQGYNNYDGYGVYSTSFTISESLALHDLVFMVGRIDDVDRVFINGKLVGSTGKYKERRSENYYLEFRNYFFPKGILKPGLENTVVVKVWDEVWDGGIVEGPIGIISQDKFRKYWMSQRRN